MDGNTFIGIGHNPDGPDLPLGLGMQLAQEPSAMAAFASMNNAQKTQLIAYLQATNSGAEAKNRMAEVMRKLGDGQMQF